MAIFTSRGMRLLLKTIIAIDGPAAAGKSTVAKLLAKKLSYIYIDTGAMYRALTLEALNKGISLNDEQCLVNLLEKIEIDVKQNDNMDKQQIFINGNDVTTEIRSTRVSNLVS